MLDRLRYFALVVEHGTFTAAAEKAHVSQPALTSAIAKLEQEMGARLFLRGPGGASLTAEGKALLPRARAALAAVEDGKRAVAEVSGLEAGEVRIGGGATACMYFLPPVLAEFRKAHPRVRLVLREATADSVLDGLEAGSLDLGVTTTERGERWFDDELILVRAPSLDVRGAPFVTFPLGGSTREMLDRHFPGAPIAMEIGSIAAIVAHACEGVGVALVSRHAVRREIAAKKLVRVPHPVTPIKRHFHVV
ncbi:MAG TPA: LysR family transcriptional regulator, partial [Polyangiaceae bacterium]